MSRINELLEELKAEIAKSNTADEDNVEAPLTRAEFDSLHKEVDELRQRIAELENRPPLVISPEPRERIIIKEEPQKWVPNPSPWPLSPFCDDHRTTCGPS